MKKIFFLLFPLLLFSQSEQIVLPAVKSVKIPDFYAGEIKLHTTQISTITLRSFAIQKYETTCAEWLSYMQTAGVSKERTQEFKDLCLNDLQPISNVTWDEAQDYCKAKGGKLPSEEEWMVAAGVALKPFECYKQLKANSFFSYATGVSPELMNSEQLSCITDVNKEDGNDIFIQLGMKQNVTESLKNINGTYGMLGNLLEWVDEELTINHKQYKVLKGGSFLNSNTVLLYDNRISYPAPRELEQDNVGFRCAWKREE